MAELLLLMPKESSRIGCLAYYTKRIQRNGVQVALNALRLSSADSCGQNFRSSVCLYQPMQDVICFFLMFCIFDVLEIIPGPRLIDCRPLAKASVAYRRLFLTEQDKV